MSEEQIRELERKVEEEIKTAELDEDYYSSSEVITPKDATVLPVVRQVGRRFQRVTKTDADKLKKAKTNLKKIATSLGKERAKLQEIYKIKKEYFLADGDQSITRELADKLFGILNSETLDREKLSKAAEYLIRLDHAQKLTNTLDLEIEARRLSIEKLKKQAAESGVKKDEQITFNVRTKISRLKERFSFSRIARKMKKNAEFRIKINEQDDKITDSRFKNAFLSGKDLEEAIESISDKSFEELQTELATATTKYNEANNAAEAFVRENHHYTTELLEQKRDTWDEYANAFWLTIIKAQELERKNHYEQLRSVFAKYGTEKREDGTIICKIGDEEFEVKKDSLLSDAEKVLAVALEFEEAEKQTEKSEPDMIDELDEEQEIVQPEPITEEETIEETTAPEEVVEETPEVIEEGIKEEAPVSLQEDILTPATEEKEVSAAEKLKAVETEYEQTAKDSKRDLLAQKKQLIDERRQEIEKEIADAKAKNDRIIEIRNQQLNELHGTPTSIGNVFDRDIDSSKDLLVPVTITDENGKEDVLYPVTKADLANLESERIKLLNDYRDVEKEIQQDVIDKTREQVAQKKDEKALKDAREFFKYVDTATTTGYDISGLSDEEVMDLYNEISKDKSNSVYVNAMAKMTEEKNKVEEKPEEIKEEPTEEVTTTYETDYNEQEELDKEIDEQINSVADKGSDSVYEGLIDILSDKFKQQGLSTEGAEYEAVKHFKEQHPNIPLPDRYASYEDMENRVVDTSGIDVMVSDNVEPTEVIATQGRRR